MLIRINALVSLFFILATGCATFQPKPLSPSQTASAFEARTLDSVELKKFIEANLRGEVVPWPPRAWDFGLLTLAAYYYHPDLDVARARWEVAEAGIITAGARPNPSLRITPEFSTNPPSGVSPWTVGPILDIPIETAGKRGYRIAQAQHLSSSSRLQIASAAWQVRSRLRAALLNLYTATQRETILKKQVWGQEDMVSLLGKRLTYGEISQPVLTQAQISFDRARLLLQENQKKIAENRVKVAEALGLPVDALHGIDLSFSFLEEIPAPLSLKGMKREALLKRLDILSALAEYEAAQAALQLEIARQFPDFSLGPGYRFDEGENKWSLGFSVVLPVFNRNEGPIAQAEARRLEASARFMALQAGVIGEIDRGLAAYSQALQKLKIAGVLYTAQKKQNQSIQARFAQGETDRLAVLSAQLELNAGALSRLDALVQAQQSIGLLEDALQQPLHPPRSRPIAPEANPREKDGR
jgi:cobalt-zinc-cadmium efflux system outer membrane protein